MGFKSSFAIAAAAAGMVFSGCTAAVFTGYEAENTKKIAALADSAACDFAEYSKYEEAAATEAGSAIRLLKIDDPIYHGNSLGLKALICERYEKSLDFFRAAQNARENASTAGAVGKAVVGALVNENATDYAGVHYELPTAHAYMGLDQLALGNIDDAYRTMRATEELQKNVLENFRSEMEKEQKKLAGEDKESGGLYEWIVQKMMNEHKDKFGVEPELAKDYQDALMRSKKNFLNTFADYLAAVTYYIRGDVDEASFVMKNMAQTLNDAEYAKEAKFMRSKNHPAQIWVIYENGLMTPLEEFKFSMPFPSFAAMKQMKEQNIPVESLMAQMNQMGSTLALFNSIEFAVSVLGEPQSAYESISANGHETRMLSDMDAIIRAEYRATLPTRLLKAVVNTAVAQAAQEAAGSQNGWLGVGMTLLSHAKNKADVRYFVGLPQNYQAVRVANNGELKIKAGGEVIYAAQLDKKQNYLAYVKSVPNTASESKEIINIVQIISKDGLVDEKGAIKRAHNEEI